MGVLRVSTQDNVVAVDMIENGFLVRYIEILPVGDPNFALKLAQLAMQKRDSGGGSFGIGEDEAPVEAPKAMIKEARTIFCADEAAVAKAVLKVLGIIQAGFATVQAERTRILSIDFTKGGGC